MRVAKFAIVGASGVAVNLGLLWIFTEVAGMFYLFSAAISIEASIITNFFLNEHWTFADRRNPEECMGRRGLKFNVVSVIGMIVNISVLFAFTDFAGFHYMVSECAGIAAGFAFNFLLNIRWTWG